MARIRIPKEICCEDFEHYLEAFWNTKSKPLARALLKFAKKEYAYAGQFNFRRFFDIVAADSNEQSTDLIIRLFADALVGEDSCFLDVVPFRDILKSLQTTKTIGKIHTAILAKALIALSEPDDIMFLCEVIYEREGLKGFHRIADEISSFNLTYWTCPMKPESAPALHRYFKECGYPPLLDAFFECAAEETPFGIALAWELSDDLMRNMGT